MQNKMASGNESYKLRKQIDVLSSLIDSHKQLKEKELATKNTTWNITRGKNNLNSSSRILLNRGNAKLSPRFSLDRRKRQLIHVENDSGATSIPSLSRRTISLKDDERGKAEVYSTKSPILRINKSETSVDPQTSIVISDGNLTKTKNMISTTEAASLSARLSSLSSSIASTKNKIQASNIPKNVKPYKLDSSSRTYLSQPEKCKTQSVYSTLIPSTSGLKWDKKQPTKNKLSKVNSKNLRGTPKSSAFSWNNMESKQTNSQDTTVNSVPASKSTLKWSKDGSSKFKSLAGVAISTDKLSSKHVWKNSIISRQKRSSSGFMKQRQKVVQKLNSKKNALSRYHFVSSNNKEISPLQSTSKVKIVKSTDSLKSANQLTEQSRVDKTPHKNNLKNKSSKLLTISGNKYSVNCSRNILKRIHSTTSQPSTSKTTTLVPLKKRFSTDSALSTSPGGFVRSSHGRKTISSQIRHRSVQSALRYKYKKKSKSNQFCIFYNRFGKCNKGSNCPYIHDPTKIAVCTKFLKGKCDKTDGSCPFSHKIDKDKMPVCQFFLKDMCTKEDCPYLHVNVSSKAEVCEDFVKGYCPLGQECKRKHIVDCEEFLFTGKCSKGKKCNLVHRLLKPRTNKRKSSAKVDYTAVAKQPIVEITEDEGYLPLESYESMQKEPSQTRSEIEEKERVKTLSIKPRFLLSKDYQEEHG